VGFVDKGDGGGGGSKKGKHSQKFHWKFFFHSSVFRSELRGKKPKAKRGLSTRTAG